MQTPNLAPQQSDDLTSPSQLTLIASTISIDEDAPSSMTHDIMLYDGSLNVVFNTVDTTAGVDGPWNVDGWQITSASEEDRQSLADSITRNPWVAGMWFSVALQTPR